MTPKKIIEDNLKKSILIKHKILENYEFLEKFAIAAEMVLTTYKKGGKLFIAGNGGSAADSQHLAAEFVSKLTKDRHPLAAEALTVDTSVLTAIGNDYGFDQIFSRQLIAKASKIDIFLAITTSGNSVNIIRALEECERLSIPTILFAGKDGGLAKKIANVSLIVPSSETASIQELHIVLCHSICEYVENSIFP